LIKLKIAKKCSSVDAKLFSVAVGLSLVGAAENTMGIE
jgi:hypothetical protein